MGPKNMLGLTVRYPEPGLVKTRLAKDIGDDEACRIYKVIAEKIIAETMPDDGSYERIIFYSSPVSEREVTNWLPGERIVPQKGKDIGGIMDNAFCAMFETGAEKAVVAGVDVPGLDRRIVNRALRELEYTDVVIGPARDGGYYLIGLKSRVPEIFRGISWGTEKVFGETLGIIGKLGLTVGTVNAMTDVDTLDDLLKVRVAHPHFFQDLKISSFRQVELPPSS